MITYGECPCGITGTLVDGRCAYCEGGAVRVRRVVPTPARPSCRVNALLTALLAELVAGDVPDPLAQPFTLGVLWGDLCRLAGETPPALLAALLPDDDPAPPLAVARGSYAEHGRQFPEVPR